jgi:WS/DGAT/MGAT family acyltransferase
MSTRATSVVDRMGPLDSAFWALEDRHSSLHIASIAVFDGAPPTQLELRGVYRRALTRIPRLRQRMHAVPLQLGRPVWVDDPHVDLGYHLRRTALPAPGGDAELDAFMGRLMATHLDPERPLWEVWLVEGLAEGHWALVTKLHHSMLDGMSGMALLTRVFETTPDAAPARTPRRSVPDKAPGRARLIRTSVAGQLRSGMWLGGRMAAASTHPLRTAVTVAHVGRGLVGYAGAVVRPVASSPLRGPLGAPRRYVTASAELADVDRVRRALGGSVNDVVLAMATAGLRELLVKRGHDGQDGHDVRPHTARSLVPVSVRAAHDDSIDNQVSALLADLPVECTDPIERYRAVCARTARLKTSHEAEAGTVLAAAGRYVPAPLLALGLRLAARAPQRAVSTVVTNVPGPRGPLYLLGRRLVAHYPCVPIADRIRIGIAVTSYDGRLWFGITGDGNSMPDVDVVAAGIERELTELLVVVEGSS